MELGCFDGRVHRAHTITFPFAQESLPVRETIYRAAIRHYQPGGPRRGLLITTILNEVPKVPLGLEPPRANLASVSHRLIIPKDLWECVIDLRWRELGYESVSQYFSNLILADLLYGGKHQYFNDGDTDPVLLASMDAETIRIYREEPPARTYIDHLLRQVAGRDLSPVELEQEMQRVSEAIRQYAMETDRKR